MNGIDFLADTNAIIYLLAGNECMKPYLNKNLYVSCISEMEILSYHGLTPADESVARSFLSNCIIVDLGKEIRELTITLIKKYRLKLPDSIIAATAQKMKLALLTADKGFLRIGEIDTVLLDPAARAK